MNYIFISDLSAIRSNDRNVIKKLLVQCLVEYKFLLTLNNLLITDKKTVIDMLETHGISNNDMVSFSTLFNYFPYVGSELKEKKIKPPIRSRTRKIIKYREDGGFDYSDYGDDASDYSVPETISSISTYFSEYIGIDKIMFTYEEIDQLIRNLDSNLLEFAQSYWKQLLESTCTIDKIYSDLKNVDSQFDSKNYSIYCLQSSLDGKLRTLIKSDIYLIYQTDKEELFAGHIFVIVNNKRFIKTNYIELISIQTSTLMVINFNCQKLRSGVATEIFKYILDKFYPDIIKTNYNFNTAVIHAYAWRVISNLLHQKFDFDYFEYSPVSSLDEFYPSNDDDPSDSYNYLKLFTREHNLTTMYEFHQKAYTNMEAFNSLNRTLGFALTDKQINIINKLNVINQSIDIHIGDSFNQTLYVFTFKILFNQNVLK